MVYMLHTLYANKACKYMCKCIGMTCSRLRANLTQLTKTNKMK